MTKKMCLMFENNLSKYSQLVQVGKELTRLVYDTTSEEKVYLALCLHKLSGSIGQAVFCVLYTVVALFLAHLSNTVPSPTKYAASTM